MVGTRGAAGIHGACPIAVRNCRIHDLPVSRRVRGTKSRSRPVVADRPDRGNGRFGAKQRVPDGTWAQIGWWTAQGKSDASADPQVRNLPCASRHVEPGLRCLPGWAVVVRTQNLGAKAFLPGYRLWLSVIFHTAPGMRDDASTIESARAIRNR
jgi:hypothetical protein